MKSGTTEKIEPDTFNADKSIQIDSPSLESNRDLNGDSYELSPLQEGMLIHSLAEQGVGMYVSQGVHSFAQIDVEAMQQAWQKVVDRHEVLRTSFVWEDIEKPLQIVHPKVKVEFEFHYLQEFEEWEQKIKLRAILAQDRNKGFDLTSPPLFRLLLIQRSETAYYLVFSHHHLLLDGWSNPILLDEVRTFYQAILRSGEVSLPRPKPFRVYIRWLKQQTLESEKSFWQEYLKDFKRTTPIPYDLGANRQAGYPVRSDEWPLEIREPLFTALKKTAQKCHVTLNTLIQGAWVILLSRYSGDGNIVFGSLVSGRSSVLEGIESMIGMFLNTLPMHVKVDEKASLNVWLKYLHTRQNVLHEHEHTPLNLVQRWSELSRGSNLFDSVIDTNNTHQPQENGEDDDDAVMAPINQSIPMLLFAKPAASRLVLILIYNNRRFLKSCIVQIGEQLIALLTSMCEDIHQPVGELSMISEAEAQRTIVTWNETKTDYPETKTLHQLFEARAASSPNAPAVYYQDSVYSYETFNQKANQLAHHLKSIGITRGKLVGFCLERSLDMVVVLMAILKSGAGYVPLDPNYPFDRLKMMLTRSKAELLITQKKWLNEIGDIAPHNLCVDTEANVWATQKTTNLDVDLSPDDIAYVLFTSGSTGVPKGIVIPHRVAVNRMFIEFDPFEPDEALCAKTSICFVDSVWELWSAWSNGLPVTLIQEDHIKDPAKLIQTLADSGSTRMVLVPSLLRSMLDTEPELGKKLPRMKHWICSGEALPGDLSARFVQMMPNAVLTNLYGATEIWDVTRCDTRDDLPYDPMPIGKTMGNMQGYVLDDMMRPVPIGTIGELHFSGVHMAHGYWMQPDITARQFVPNPFSKKPGQRLYKTGDLGRLLPDGNFEYLGRRDQQIQLRGLRIELGDIESVIRQHPDIVQAAVVVSDDQRLVAYIVTKNGSPPASSELRKLVRLQLPEYMTPAFYLPLEDIPLTPNGKTDRRKLPRPQAEEMKHIIEREAISRAPETPTEKIVASIWANFLGLDRVGAESDFFQLGGESLMAVRIISQVGKILKITIPLSVLMKTRTVEDMAAWIDDALENGVSDTTTDLPKLSKVDHGKKAPLSYAQQQMWLLDQLNPGSVSYTVPNIMSFPMKIDIKILNRTLTEVIRRHETLRTTFSAIDGKPFQVINEVEDVSVPEVDLTGLPIETRNMASRKQMREQARMPWDLEKGPLFRFMLIKMDEEQFILAMTLHHITTDGRSMGILSSEIQTLYKAFDEGNPSPLKELPIQYADYAIWQRGWLKGEQIESQINYWKRKLDDISVLEIPTDYPRPKVHRYRGGQVTISLDKSIVHDMREVALEEGATIFMALLASFHLLMARYTGQDDICIGTPTTNRSQPQLEHLIGYFINTLVIRIKLDGNPSFRELLNQVKLSCIEAYDNQEVPFEKLVDRLGVQRNLGYNPLFQILFVHQKLVGEESNVFSSRQTGPEQETANFDLVLNVQEYLDKVECKFIYNSDLFEESTILHMGKRLELLIQQCVAQPDQALSQTSMLLPSERHQILQLFSRSESYPRRKRLAHQVISEYARKYPAKTAVRLGSETLSYLELDQYSNQMARHLRKKGVRSETVVGWCVERVPAIFIGLLGIMKAGGAFLPLDPSLPQERMEHMLKDTAASLVITQKKLLDKIPDKLCKTVLLDDYKDVLVDYENVTPDFNVKPKNLAYIIYTSGSTGLPKGVMVEHRNLTNLISAQIPGFNVTKDSRVLQTLSLSFDAALGEIFRTLMAGATLHLAHKDDLMPGQPLIDLLKNQEITSVALSAAALAALPKVSNKLDKLKNLTVGGDTCSPELVEHWKENRRFMNAYGPTETTIGATLAVGWDSHAKPPLGRPLPNVEAYVLDRWMQPVPVGTPGELYIGGVGVSRGYLNRPEQTASNFVPNPYDNQNGGTRLYRTGDLVRWLPDGKLDFLGRMDHQVKIRGYRIELSEIESALNRHPKVGQAVVIVHKTNGNKRLAAYVTPMDDLKPDSSELRLFLKACLPDYMVPAFLIVCESFPMTINNKIDRNALPKPSSEQLQLEQEYVAPKTDLEKLLADIWADVLGLEKVGIQSNYFELGGDSIMSIRVVARITEVGYQLSLKEMFTHQTVAELAAALSSGDTSVMAEQGMITGDVPLTPVQHWFFEQESGNPHYFNQWMTVPTPPALNCDKMRDAVVAVTRHHDALRMRYKKRDGNFWTQYNSDIIEPAPFSVVDLSALPDRECEPVIHEAFHRLQQSLDLESGPIFQVCWFNPGPHLPGRLLVVVHHIVMDIVSWTSLVEDLMNAYRQLDNSQEVKLPIKTSSFKQWALGLTEYACSQELKEEIHYWRNIAEQTFQPLPVDFPNSDHSLATTQSIFIEMTSSQTWSLLNTVTELFETQLNHILLAALAIAIHRHSGNIQVQIKVEGQGREDIGVELNLSRSLGWFTSFYPVSLSMKPDLELKEHVRSIIHQIEAVPNRGIGYSVLRYLNSEESIRTDMLSIPESEVTFNFTGQSSLNESDGKALSDDNTDFWGMLATTGKIQLAESDQGLRRHLIEIGAGVMDDLLVVRFAYGGKRFKKTTVQQLGNELKKTLEDLINVATI